MTCLLVLGLVVIANAESAGEAKPEAADLLDAKLVVLRAGLAGTANLDESALREVAFTRDSRVVDFLMEVLTSPESLAFGPCGEYVFRLACEGIEWNGASRAIPALRLFLSSRLGADTLDDGARLFGSPRAAGFWVNYGRVLDAIAAARALYQLGDWRTALPALERLAMKRYSDPVPHHLYRAADLDLSRYRSDGEAVDSTTSLLRRLCTSPALRVQAQAASTLIGSDAETAYRTAVRLLDYGPDESPAAARRLIPYKTVALSVLARVDGAEARAALTAYAGLSDRPLLCAEARKWLARRQP